MRKDALLDLASLNAAYLREALTASGLGLWEYDTRSGQTRWSACIFHLLGRPEGDLPADGWLSLVHPDDLASLQTAMETAQTPDHPQYLAEFRLRHSDGRWLWVQARGRVMEHDSDGQTLRTVGTLAEITAQKQAEAARQQRELYFQFLTEHITEVFWLADVELATLFYVSPAYEQIWQRSRADLYAKPKAFLESIHPDDLARVLAGLAVQNQGLPFDHEYRIVWPDGSVRWIWDRGFPIVEADGSVTRYAGLAEDITERKQAEESLHSSQLRYRQLFEQSVDGIFLVGERGRFLAVNSAACQITGYSQKELLERGIADMLEPDEIPRIPEQMAHVSAGEVRRSEWRARRKDGSAFVAEIWARKLPESEQHLAILRDITDRRLAETALKESDRRKDEFLATLAHELRNPLAPIRNVLHVLQKFQASGQIQQAQTPALLACTASLLNC